MPMTFSLISQDKVVAEKEVDEVLLPTETGQIGILPHHANLVTQIRTGEITAISHGKLDHYAVFGGVASVNGREVVVLADRAEHVDDIDLAKAEEAKKQAEQLKTKAADDFELADATALLERNLNRIHIANLRRHHTTKTHRSDNFQQ